MNLSLAQWVASNGGVRIDSGSLAGEVARVRELNRMLRGKRSIVRPTGQEPDVLAIWARHEGFPVDERTFLDELERDAIGLAAGSHKGRVYADWDLDPYLDAFELSEGDPEPTECHRCKVCGSIQDFDTVCNECCRWAVSVAKWSVESFFETIQSKERGYGS